MNDYKSIINSLSIYKTNKVNDPYELTLYKDYPFGRIVAVGYNDSVIVLACKIDGIDNSYKFGFYKEFNLNKTSNELIDAYNKMEVLTNNLKETSNIMVFNNELIIVNSLEQDYNLLHSNPLYDTKWNTFRTESVFNVKYNKNKLDLKSNNLFIRKNVKDNPLILEIEDQSIKTKMLKKGN